MFAARAAMMGAASRSKAFFADGLQWRRLVTLDLRNGRRLSTTVRCTWLLWAAR